MSEKKQEPDAGQVNGTPTNGHEDAEAFRQLLLRDAHKYRLPPELKEKILSELPPLEERERGYRELMEHGGHSFEEFIASLPEDMRAAFDERE